MNRRSALPSLCLLLFACSESSGQDEFTPLTQDATGSTDADADANADTATVDADTDTASDAATDQDGLVQDADTAPDAAPTPSTSGITLVINEVAPTGDPTDWFELHNTGTEPVPLDRVSFTDDLVGAPQRSPFPEGVVVEPGGYYVQTLDDTFPGFSLGGDEELAITDDTAAFIDFVDWADGDAPVGASFARLPNAVGEFATTTEPTPGAANRSGASLENCGDAIVDASEGCDDGNEVEGDGCSSVCTEEEGWACQAGSPSVCDTLCGDGIRAGAEECDDGNTTVGDGCDDLCLRESATSSVRINELLVNSELEPDWIEFVNVGDDSVDLTGWSFSDSDPTHLFLFADGASIPARGYLVLVRDEPESFTFGFSRNGDSAILFDPDGREVDETSYDGDALLPDETWGRVPDGVGAFAATSVPTRGEGNQ